MEPHYSAHYVRISGAFESMQVGVKLISIPRNQGTNKINTTKSVFTGIFEYSEANASFEEEFGRIFMSQLMRCFE